VLVWLVVMGGALALYWPSFSIRPSGDDFNPLLQLYRGEDLGLWAFFSRPSHVRHYRPLQELGTWAFASMFAGRDLDGGMGVGRELGIHIANFIGLGVLLAGALLWAREMPVRRLGVAAAGAAVGFHPVLAGQVSGLDMYACTLAPGLMWIAAWCLFRLRQRPAAGLAAALPIFVAAILMKEYAYGLVPLGALTVFWFRERGRLGAGAAVGVVLGLVLVALMAARLFTSPDDAAGASVQLPRLSVLNIPYNLGLYAAGLLLPVNTAWVFTHRGDPLVLGAAAASAGVVVALLAGGLWWRVARDREAGVVAVGNVASAGWWVLFLALAAPAASFPNNVLDRVSENYTSAPLIVLALATGLAADGWRSAGRVWRRGAGVVAAGILVLGVATARAKMEQVRAAGELAHDQMRQILAFLPEEARDLRIALVYLAADVRKPAYSVYVLPDDVAACPPIGLDWLRPRRNLRTTAVVVDRPEEADVTGYDLALLWDAKARAYRPIGGQNAGGDGR
jgi:hypothetical protein